MSPLISVVMPVHNVEQTIERAIRSCLRQLDFKAFELIIVDDCGDDGSIALARRQADLDPRIRIVANPQNLGTYHARCTGVDAARGELIVFLDPDDELKDHTFVRLAEAFRNNQPDIIFYGIDIRPRRPFYRTAPRAYVRKRPETALHQAYSPWRRDFVWATTAGKAYRKQPLVRHLRELNVPRDFRFVFCEDQALLYTYLLQNPKCRNLDYRGYIYHRNARSISRATDAATVRSNYRQHRAALAFVKAAADRQAPHCPIAARLVRRMSADLCLYGRKLSDHDYVKFLWGAFRHDAQIRILAALAVYGATGGRIRV